MVFVIQQIQLEASVGEVIHISSDENWRADELSRGGDLAALVRRDSRFAGVRRIEAGAELLVPLCNPAYPIDSDVLFAAYWTAIRSAVRC
jgi:hypothetical protein